MTRHGDHIAAHRAAMDGVGRVDRDVRVFYMALEGEWAKRMELDGPETQPTHRIDVTDFVETKLAALACHSSQEDAREFFFTMAEQRPTEELFHQALPAFEQEQTAGDLFA